MEVLSHSTVRSLNLVQPVLDVPELKVAKPSDTPWPMHEMCVNGAKTSYGVIVAALTNIHKSTHEPEALGLSKALSKQSKVAAIYMLDYVLPQVAKLSRTLQTENLDLSMICGLVDATLHMLDDTLVPSVN